MLQSKCRTDRGPAGQLAVSCKSAELKLLLLLLLLCLRVSVCARYRRENDGVDPRPVHSARSCLSPTLGLGDPCCPVSSLRPPSKRGRREGPTTHGRLYGPVEIGVAATSQHCATSRGADGGDGPPDSGVTPRHRGTCARRTNGSLCGGPADSGATGTADWFVGLTEETWNFRNDDRRFDERLASFGDSDEDRMPAR